MTALDEYHLANEGRGSPRRRGGAGLSLLPGKLHAAAQARESGRYAAGPEAAQGRWLGSAQANQVGRKAQDDTGGRAHVFPRKKKDMVASYRLGVNAYVVKPVDFHEFCKTPSRSSECFGQ